MAGSAGGAALAEGATLELSPTASAAPLLPQQGTAAEALRRDAAPPEDRLSAPVSPPSVPPVAAAVQPPQASLPKAPPDAAAAGIASAKSPPSAVHPGAAALPAACALHDSAAGAAKEVLSPACSAALLESTRDSDGAHAEAPGSQAAHAGLQQRSKSFEQGRGGFVGARLVINLTGDSSSPWQLPESYGADVGHILARAPAARSEPSSPQVVHAAAVFETRPAKMMDQVSEGQPRAS